MKNLFLSANNVDMLSYLQAFKNLIIQIDW